DAAWPLQGALTGMTMSVPWHGSERTVQVRLSRTTTPEVLARGYEGVAGNQTDGFIFMGFPDAALQSAGQPALDEGLSETPASTVIFWQPRQRNAAEQDLWHEFACWHLAAHTANPADTTPEKQLRRYCQQREDELRAATVASVQAIYAEGSCYDARGQRCHFTPGETLTTTLADILATGFDELFPVFSTMPAHDLPPHHVVEHIISQFIVPGTITLTPQSLLSTYLERYVQPLGCVAVQDHQATVVSPGPEIIRTLLATVSDTPVRITEILAMLHAKPLGLPAAYGRIAIAAATRTGVMQGFDAFVQPVAPDTPAAEIALVGIPEPVADEFRDAIKLLAEFWDIPQVPWQLTCSQVNLRLRNWLTETAHRIPVIHDAVSSWSDVLDILPWGWKSTHDALTAVQRAEELPQPSFGDLLRSLSTPRNLITQVDRLWEATTWWQEHREMVSYIFNHALPEHVSVEAETLQERLSSGEEALENFPNTRHRFDEMISAYHAAYQQWHDTVFGTRVVNALREAFAHPDFRAIKLLVRLPLPIPDTVQHCLKALEQARTAYCPGVFSNFALHGVCEHCHLPFGSASPMPEAHQILEWAMTGLREYVNLLATHEWSINIRKSLQRAPEDITLRVEQLFTWHIEHGSEVIPTILDEQVLTWLCHDRQVKGTRQVAQLHARLAGRDLTIAEAQTQLHEWLNPGHDCDDDTLLAFE
ncbi:MAG TPA: hypothetical protein VHV83_19385, partial [Armatimonadota bacterium]|nr:hypothetical protein [Armatimonadota bacterium]